MKIVERKGKDPKVEELPEGNLVLFFGLVSDVDSFGYLVVFGSPESVSNTENLEIGIQGTNCKVAFGNGRNILIYPVIHGHKYFNGGGMVETEIGGAGWRPKEDKRGSFWEGHKFQKVYISL